ncbi:MAG: hypothetical protein SFT93_04545, partial [Rickettsiaceae bacterium]|nr:hypothetical protein [Rickettsiaceae bacterium]
NIMETAKWTPDQQALYLKQKMREQDLRLTHEEEKREAYDRGKLEGEIKGEIHMIKVLLDNHVEKEKIIQSLKHLTNATLQHNLDKNLAYIQEHINDTDSQICKDLGLDSEADLSSMIP